MSVITRPTRARQPPAPTQLDGGSPVARLFRSGFLASFSQRLYPAAGPAFTSDTTARSAAAGGIGLEIKSATAPDTKYTGTVSNWLSGATQATFLCVFTPRSVPSGTTEERLFSRWGVGSGNDQFIVQMYGSNIGVAVRSASFIEARRSSGISLEAGKLYVAVCTWNASRSSTDRHRFWLNGAALSSVDWFVNGTATSINTSTSPELQFGQDNGGTTRASDVVILAAGVIPADIGNTAAANISVNPWQLFAPIPRRLFFGGAGTGAITGDVAESLSLSEALAGTAVFSSEQQESVTLADAAAVAAEFSSAQAESVALSDSAEGAWSTQAALSEALGLSDSCDATTGPTTYDVDVAEALALADSSTGEFPFQMPQITGADAWPRKRDTLREDVLEAIEQLAPSKKIEREAKQAFKRAVDAPQAPSIGPALAQAITGASERIQALVAQAITQAQAQQRRARRRKQQQQLLLM